MQLRFQEHEAFFIFDKPYGLRTHQVADGQFGFVEFLNEKLQKSLFVVHRLDSGTSGLILFAKGREAAATLSSLFEKHLIQKTYYFLTDRKTSESDITVRTHIEKQNGTYFNLEGREPNSETVLKFVRSLGRFDLWEARPKTGKPHQIRLHAEKAGVPILGDPEHGGTRFFRMALHAARLEFTFDGTPQVFESELPPLFTRPFAHPVEALLWENLHKRRSLYHLPENESYRLLHLESPELRADVFGDRLWIYDYTRHGLAEEDPGALPALAAFAAAGGFTLIVRHMLNRGQGVGGLENRTLQVSTPETEWIATEEDVKYGLRIDSGFSPGLFLDQRENRKWVREHSGGLRVLNLFSYTAGFSINAALALAQEVTTVDVSSKFLGWARENFKLNGLDPERFEFFAQDSAVFLKGSVKRGRQWDLIICDPPSFGRAKDSIWKLESDLPLLAKHLTDCLAPGGRVLFTCNLEKRTRSEILDLFFKNIKKTKLHVDRLPMMSLDFELTDDLNNVMKGFLLTKM